MAKFTNEARQVAIIGLGAMGSRIAAKILSSGHQLAVYNRDRSRAEPLVALGASLADTAGDAVRDAQVVLTCLRGVGTELHTALGADGFLRAMKKGAVHASLSTVAPDVATRLAQAHSENGTRYLACPMQGRPQSIDAGQLALWASGAKEDLDFAAPVLGSFTAHLCHIGDSPESAPVAKLAANMLMFANIELFAESAAYLQKSGVDAAKVFGLLTEGPFATPLFKGIAAALRGDHASDGSTSVATSLLDLELLMKHARSVEATLPAAAAVTAQYAATVKAGWGGLAQSAVLLPLSKR